MSHLTLRPKEVKIGMVILETGIKDGAFRCKLKYECYNYGRFLHSMLDDTEYVYNYYIFVEDSK